MQWSKTLRTFGTSTLTAGLAALLTGCVLPLVPASGPQSNTTMPTPPILATRKDPSQPGSESEPALSNAAEALAWAERLHTLPHEELIAELEQLHATQESASDPMLQALQLALVRRVIAEQDTVRQLKEQGAQQTQQLQDQQKRLSALTQQLELLRSIERSLPVRSGSVGTVNELPDLPPESSNLAPLPAITPN